jgi:hypothetical protein
MLHELMEEFGGCTAPPGEASQVWEWTAYGERRTQFMASEEDFAAYIEAVLPRLVQAGATGAMIEKVAAQMVTEKVVRIDRAEEILKRYS